MRKTYIKPKAFVERIDLSDNIAGAGGCTNSVSSYINLNTNTCIFDLGTGDYIFDTSTNASCNIDTDYGEYNEFCYFSFVATTGTFTS